MPAGGTRLAGHRTGHRHPAGVGNAYRTELSDGVGQQRRGRAQNGQVQDKLLAILEARLKEVKESLTERFDAAMESLRAQTLAQIRVESKAGLTHENNIF